MKWLNPMNPIKAGSHPGMVLKMAPGETYVRRHLQIVNMRIAKRRIAAKGKAVRGSNASSVEKRRYHCVLWRKGRQKIRCVLDIEDVLSVFAKDGAGRDLREKTFADRRYENRLEENSGQGEGGEGRGVAMRP